MAAIRAPLPYGAPVVSRQYAQPTTSGPTINRKLAFTPFKASPIPSGLFSPTREIELDTGAKGAENKETDLGAQRLRGEDDYTTALEGIGREQQQSQGDINTARANQAAAYQTAVKSLSESFQKLGQRQTEQANTAGVLDGGALLQSAAKRAGNEGLRKKSIDESNAQATASLAEREGELNQSAELNRGKLGLTQQRSLEDIATELTRTQKEQAAYAANVHTLEGDEAASAGYSPAQKPSNQYTTSTGQVYHTISHGNQWWDVTPSGQVLKKRNK
jgi:hypothetical protein